MDEAGKNLVLIVDDEEQNLKVMGLLLDRHGYAFQTAKNGIEALAKVKEISPEHSAAEFFRGSFCERSLRDGAAGKV